MGIPKGMIDKIKDHEDVMAPELDKVRDANKSYFKLKRDEDSDSIERIEALEYFRHTCMYFKGWIEEYIGMNEGARNAYENNDAVDDAAYSEAVQAIKKIGDQLKNTEAVLLKEKLRTTYMKSQVNILHGKIDDAREDGQISEKEKFYWYDKYHNMTLKEWFKMRFIRKFIRSRN